MNHYNRELDLAQAFQFKRSPNSSSDPDAVLSSVEHVRDDGSLASFSADSVITNENEVTL